MSIFKDKNFKGEKYVDKDGYIMVRMPEHEKPLFHPMYGARGYGFEHRVNMAKKIGRPLTVHETVHHIDKNRQNNHPDNLEIHLRHYHHKEHIKNGDYKLFSKDYQPRWKKEAAMSGNTRRVISTLGGALLGNIPAALTYRKSTLMDNPEEARGLKRKALEQAAKGTALGAFGGYTVGGVLKYMGKDKEGKPMRNKLYDRIMEMRKKKEKGDKGNLGIDSLHLLAGMGAGTLAGKEWAKGVKDEDPEVAKRKRLFRTSLGFGAGTLAGGLNIIT